MKDICLISNVCVSVPMTIKINNACVFNIVEQNF